jgi:hypothetical protein
MFQQLLRRQFLVARQGEARMTDHHQFVVATDFAFEVGLVRQRFDEADVNGMFQHTILDRL